MSKVMHRKYIAQSPVLRVMNSTGLAPRLSVKLAHTSRTNGSRESTNKAPWIRLKTLGLGLYGFFWGSFRGSIGARVRCSHDQPVRRTSLNPYPSTLRRPRYSHSTSVICVFWPKSRLHQSAAPWPVTNADDRPLDSHSSKTHIHRAQPRSRRFLASRARTGS